MKYDQQGDVLIKPVDGIPAGAKRLNHRTLADGEHTGHSHVTEAEDVELFEENGTLYMRAPTGTTVRHEEHKPITVKPGTYVVSGVREFDHFKEEAHRVID